MFFLLRNTDEKIRRFVFKKFVETCCELNNSQGNDGVALKLVTQGPYSKNVGSRLYLLDSSSNKYEKLQLLNKEFTFDVKVSDLDCGLNGALYLVEMDADGGMSHSGKNNGSMSWGPFIYYVITFLGFLDPPPPLRQHVFSTKNKQKLAFSDPPPPTSADVIYEWSLGLPAK